MISVKFICFSIPAPRQRLAQLTRNLAALLVRRANCWVSSCLGGVLHRPAHTRGWTVDGALSYVLSETGSVGL